MSAINLNDAKYDVTANKVFNGGKAGVVNNCKIRVERKKADDADNAPKYKVILTDEAGGEVNKGYFDGFEKMSDKAKDFFVKEMKYLSSLFEVKLPEAVESYGALLDATMRGCFDNMPGKLVNVAVAYGTVDYPKRFLQVESAFSITSTSETPYLGPKALMIRPEATPAPANTGATSSTASDPWGVPAATGGDGLPF